MSRIITISRQFGSGGRELGKRLADLLQYDYYDREIIAALSKQTGLNEDYVERTLDNHAWQYVPLTFRHSFANFNMVQQTQTSLLIEQKRIIEGIARMGKDCVIVGRNADILLADEKPFSIFVFAGMDAKIRRCLERADKGEHLSHKEMEQNIRRIDKGRARTREILTDSKWGEPGAYRLMIDTTDWDIKELTPAVAEFVSRWFGRKV